MGTVDQSGEVGKKVLHGLKAAHRSAELLALLDVPDAQGEGLACHTHESRSGEGSPFVDSPGVGGDGLWSGG